MIVGIACGGYSSEAEISKKSAAIVFQHLTENGVTAYFLYIEKQQWIVADGQGTTVPFDRSTYQFKIEEKTLQFDVVFNAVHGPPGEDGVLAAELEKFGVPHTSCSSVAAALTYDKVDCITAAKKLGIPTATSLTLKSATEEILQKIVTEIGFPCFVKANRAGSSFGVYRVEKEADLPEAIAGALKEDNQVLVESALIGRECSVGVVALEAGIEVLPITEIKTDEAFFTYQAKYEGKAQEITPADFSAEITTALQELSLTLFEALELSGVVRIDFIVVDNTPHLLEINSVPGLTAASIIPQQWQCTQRPLFDLFHGMLTTALNKK